jgi:hypothetical protein
LRWEPPLRRDAAGATLAHSAGLAQNSREGAARRRTRGRMPTAYPGEAEGCYASSDRLPPSLKR